MAPIQRFSVLIASFTCLLVCSLPLTAFTADYPAKPITIVVGYSAGGGVDVMARILAEKLPPLLG